MLLNSIRITNFKGIDDAQFQFDNDFNLIIGDNGTGKTSILEAVAVGLGAFLAGIDGVRSIHFSSDEIRRENELLGEGSNNIIYKTPIKVECDLQVNQHSFCYKRQKKSVKSSRSTIEPRDICKEAAMMAGDSHTILPVISYQGISRISDQKRDRWRNVFEDDFSRVVGYTDCLDEASNTKLLTNWFRRMEQVAWQKGKKIAEYEAVKSAVSVFMCQMMEVDDITVFYDKRTEELMYDSLGEELPLRFLSSGFRTLVGMVLDISYRMAVLNPFLLEDIVNKTPGIVLIDEIDMHLHPKWQWNVVKALKTTFPKVQFIVTTHSPIVIGSCKDERLIVLNQISRDKQSNKLKFDYDRSVQGWQVNDVLEDVMKTGNRDPETRDKLERLRALALKGRQGNLDDTERIEYKNIREGLKEILPEDDIIVEEITMMSIRDMLQEDK
jgi:predicted ATP-binding protein involved in virulence